MRIKIAISIITFLLLVVGVNAQTDSEDFMSSISKIYVVVAVIVAVLIGIVLFLLYLDRKITKLENQIKDHD